MMITSGLLLLLVSLLVYLNPRVRNIESEIPDVIPDEGKAEIPVEGTPETVPTN